MKDTIKINGKQYKKIDESFDKRITVKEVRSYTGGTMKAKINKGAVTKAIILRTAKEFSRRDGGFLRFQDNTAILLGTQSQPSGSRIFGPILEELRMLKDMKLVSMGSCLM